MALPEDNIECSPCPGRPYCKCDPNSQEVDCAENAMRTLPHFDEYDKCSVPTKTWSWLHLDHNKLAYIPGRAFQGVHAKTLGLHYNALQSLADDAFKGCPIMQNLFLQQNQLRSIA